MEPRVLLLLLVCFGGALAGRRLLYPHTENNGDTKFADCLDCFEILHTDDLYRFYDYDYDDVYVSSKGVVTFERGWTRYVPIPLDLICTPMIAPLWSDNNLESYDQGENILYRETQDPDLLKRFVADIDGYFTGCGGPDFMPTSLVIVTWQRVQSWCPDVDESCWWTYYESYYYGDECDYYYYGYQRKNQHLDNRESTEHIDHVYPLPPRDNGVAKETVARDGAELEGINGFQLVLATNGDGMTFAMLNMHTIEWNCCGDYNRCGFSDGPGDYSYELPNSGTDDVSNLTTDTNVNKAGRWVFRVDSGIYDPQCTLVDW